MSRSFKPQKKALKDLTSQELRDALERNFEEDASYLAFICSEVLRRMLAEKGR